MISYISPLTSKRTKCEMVKIWMWPCCYGGICPVLKITAYCERFPLAWQIITGSTVLALTFVNGECTVRILGKLCPSAKSQQQTIQFPDKTANTSGRNEHWLTKTNLRLLLQATSKPADLRFAGRQIVIEACYVFSLLCRLINRCWG